MLWLPVLFLFLTNRMSERVSEKYLKRFSFLGPTPYPLIGNLHDIARADKIIFRALHKLSLEFGPVVSLTLGPKKHLVVSGVEELKELMHNPAFDDRSWAPAKSTKRIIDVIYSGQTIEENPSKSEKSTKKSRSFYITDVIFEKMKLNYESKCSH